MTISEALRDAQARLRAAGVDDPGRDARLLLADALGWDASRLVTNGADLIPDDARSRFESALTQREARRPVSQILGFREFRGLRFRVTPDVLDPRADTETLLDAAEDLGAARGWRDAPIRILDLGTGSGCLLLSALAAFPKATGLGVDKSAAALAVARENAAQLGLAHRAEFRIGDWLAGMDGNFNLVLTNPPYIEERAIAGLQPEVAKWEPHLALSGGMDGLEAYRAITQAVTGVLSRDGAIILEVGAGQARAVEALLCEAGLDITPARRDLGGIERAVIATNPQMRKKSLSQGASTR